MLVGEFYSILSPTTSLFLCLPLEISVTHFASPVMGVFYAPVNDVNQSTPAHRVTSTLVALLPMRRQMRSG